MKSGEDKFMLYRGKFIHLKTEDSRYFYFDDFFREDASRKDKIEALGEIYRTILRRYERGRIRERIRHLKKAIASSVYRDLKDLKKSAQILGCTYAGVSRYIPQEIKRRRGPLGVRRGRKLTWQKPKWNTGTVEIKNQKIPFKMLVRATSDIYLGDGNSFLLYAWTEYIWEITQRMDKHREFNKDDIFPIYKNRKLRKRLVDKCLEAISKQSGIIMPLRKGIYVAKKRVCVKEGKFADKLFENIPKIEIS